MIGIKTGVRAEEVRQSARHVLFVEGDLDRRILQTLFEDRIDIKALGSSFHIRSVAEALYKHHPNYYFIIDRDHYDDAFVERSWTRFPDPDTNNLLIWKRREFENYFLIPEYLRKSQFLSVSFGVLGETIRKEAEKRLFLDAANQVIISIREDLKKNWIGLFSDIDLFKSKEGTLIQLQSKSEFNEFQTKTAHHLRKDTIAAKFEEIVNQWTGGAFSLEYGRGLWLERACGKEIFHVVANQCFKVSDRENKPLQGKEKRNEIVKDLLRKPMDEQPGDFQTLNRLILERIQSP